MTGTNHIQNNCLQHLYLGLLAKTIAPAIPRLADPENGIGQVD